MAPKLLGPYQVLSQDKNDVLCPHPVAQTSHMLHDQGSIDTAKHLGLLDKEVVVRKSKGKAVKKTVVVKIAGRMEDIQLCYVLSF